MSGVYFGGYNGFYGPALLCCLAKTYDEIGNKKNENWQNKDTKYFFWKLIFFILF